MSSKYYKTKQETIINEILKLIPNPERHICGNNDGECKCECYYQAQNEIIEILYLFKRK